MSTIAQITLEEYDRMIAAGVFDPERDRRLELIDGELREMAPIGPIHEDVVDRLMEWSTMMLRGSVLKPRCQHSIGLPGERSAPQPDITWVNRRNYRRGRPTAAEVALVIEVADSSVVSDRGRKGDLYSAAGIQEYWLVDVNHECIEVRRQPTPQGYRQVQTLSGDAEVHPLASPAAVLRLKMLFEE